MINDQWIRKATLVIAAGDQGILIPPELRFTFRTTQTDVQTYNSVHVRVYNLSDRTVAKLLGATGVEYTKVILQAGYEHGALGTVFNGTIKQFAHGKENSTTSYLDIFAADGDLFNYAVVNGTVEAPASWDGQIGALSKAVTPYGGSVMAHEESNATGGVLPRGKVLYGLAVSKFRDLGKSRLTTWSVQNGVLTEVPLRGYLPGEVVKINSQTGLVGTPQTTQNGLTLTCLLNPKIVLGQRIQLNNKEINQTIVKSRDAAGPNSDALAQFASESADGIYRVCVHEMEGDTRGNAWYSHLVVLALDPSAPPAQAAQLS